MEDVFEEWDIYAKKKQLRDRKVDFDSIEKNSRMKIIAITGVRRLGRIIGTATVFQP